MGREGHTLLFHDDDDDDDDDDSDDDDDDDSDDDGHNDSDNYCYCTHFGSLCLFTDCSCFRSLISFA